MFEGLSLEIQNELEHLYKRAALYNPQLTPEKFLETIIEQWLYAYRLNKTRGLKRSKVILKNNLKSVLALRGKSQRQLAKETGLNSSYLSELINGKYEPSITVVYLIADALGYPPNRIGELFWLEPLEPDKE